MQCTKCKAMVPVGSTHCVVCHTPVATQRSKAIADKKLNISLGTPKNLHNKFTLPNNRVAPIQSQVSQHSSISAPARALRSLSPKPQGSSTPVGETRVGNELSLHKPLQDFLESGEILDHKFKLNKEIGRGGMGFVYLATDISLNRPVAIKILPPHYNDDQSIVGRFQREARAMASLDHANIVTVYSIGFYANLHYFSMKYLPGETLAHTSKKIILGNRAPFTPLEIIDLMIQACNGLEHAHNKSLLHRDIKPGNLMLSPEGKLCIMDFGIVKRLDDSDSFGLKTAHGKIFGTPEYMPPEQAMGKGDYSPASDLYALAVVGYELLCGELPYVADTPIGIIIQHIRADVPSLKGRAQNKYPLLNSIFRKCLAKKSQERYASAPDLRAALIGAQQQLMSPSFEEVPPSATGIIQSEDDFDFLDDIDSLMLEEDELFTSDLDQSALTGVLTSNSLLDQPTSSTTTIPTPTLPTLSTPEAQSSPKSSSTQNSTTSQAISSPQIATTQSNPTQYESAPETLSGPGSQVSAPPTHGLESKSTQTLKPASSRPGHYKRLPIKRK